MFFLFSYSLIILLYACTMYKTSSQCVLEKVETLYNYSELPLFGNDVWKETHLAFEIEKNGYIFRNTWHPARDCNFSCNELSPSEHIIIIIDVMVKEYVIIWVKTTRREVTTTDYRYIVTTPPPLNRCPQLRKWFTRFPSPPSRTRQINVRIAATMLRLIIILANNENNIK